MTPHISAEPGQIAPRILLAGDPLRAKFIAENYLENVKCHNEVRNMLGFTGTHKGELVSVQGVGMGGPSMSIYATELFRFYGVKSAIRIGSCGALQERINLGDLVIAIGAHATSNVNRRYFEDIDFAPVADFELLQQSVSAAKTLGSIYHVGSILTSDSFYDESETIFELLGKHQTLAVEMEGAALYTVAARHGVRALCMATVSDHIARGEAMSAEQRQVGFAAMVEVAFKTLLA